VTGKQNGAPASRVVVAALGLGLAVSLLVLGVRYGIAHHPEPARCPKGLVALDAYCCGQGQTLTLGQCAGQATACASSHVLTDGTCAPKAARVRIPSGTLNLAVSDWESLATNGSQHEAVAEFWLDATEVTVRAWADCAANGQCPELPKHASVADYVPVVNMSPTLAETYCQVQGGALPTAAQWTFAATGPSGARYPWGQTGLVCRRAVFGIADGPCAFGATHADMVAARPDGMSALGIYDLVGNVAEWTREPGGWAARGGSFRSQLAGGLKVWARTVTDQPRDDVGFRCAYGQER
jgi:hypothetical protein